MNSSPNGADPSPSPSPSSARGAASIIEIECPIPGKRSFDVHGVMFTVHEKYELIKAIGVGAYGIVMAAIDRSTGEKVAMKKISGVFEDFVDAKRILREVRLMQSLDHENVRFIVLPLLFYPFVFLRPPLSTMINLLLTEVKPK